MSAVRLAVAIYLPLILHLIPTLGIGYFIVIPQSCIAGINELTIGFAAANLGFALSYVAGVGLARKHGAALAQTSHHCRTSTPRQRPVGATHRFHHGARDLD
jgi:hypothetical protein